MSQLCGRVPSSVELVVEKAQVINIQLSTFMFLRPLFSYLLAQRRSPF
jgi:hypothetical protein